MQCTDIGRNGTTERSLRNVAPVLPELSEFQSSLKKPERELQFHSRGGKKFVPFRERVAPAFWARISLKSYHEIFFFKSTVCNMFVQVHVGFILTFYLSKKGQKKRSKLKLNFLKKYRADLSFGFGRSDGRNGTERRSAKFGRTRMERNSNFCGAVGTERNSDFSGIFQSLLTC